MNGHRLGLACAALSALFPPGCAHQPPRFDPQARRTCLVLSSGGTRGVAELGAVAAIRQARIPIGCVVGTSVGALVGALYASAPEQDTTARFRALTAAYVAETETAAQSRGVSAGLALAAVATLFSGGMLVPATAAVGGYLLGAATTTRADLSRFEQVMRTTLGGARIEALPTPFATMHHERAGEGVRLVIDRSGDLAHAVGASIANPFVFDDVDVASAPALDPGSDRLAATPVDDACRLFPDSNLLIVNVSGTPAVHADAAGCPLREIRIDTPALPPEAILGPPAEGDDRFERSWRAGFEQVGKALRE
ncbi:MAG TPA: patatin-like phospholipase family protein [Polyangia bacterium]|jgi:NTE family protein